MYNIEDLSLFHARRPCRPPRVLGRVARARPFPSQKAARLSAHPKQQPIHPMFNYATCCDPNAESERRVALPSAAAIQLDPTAAALTS